ncbi:MAG: hypothetical protein OEZ02_15345, partial [Anaerolineae bacterium]|nr:hypothetical protein [Anaerolineae bacterium]
YNLYILLRILYLSIPQRLLWGLLVLIGFISALASFLVNPERQKKKVDPPQEYHGRLETWARWIDLASQGELYKLKLKQELGVLVLNTLAHQRQQDIRQTRQQISQGEIELPDEVHRLIKSDISSNGRGFWGMLGEKLKFGQGDLRTEIDFEIIYRFIESQLEVPHNDQRHQTAFSSR